MTNYKPYSRREFERLFGGWLKRDPRRRVGFPAALVAMLALETVVAVPLASIGPVAWWLLGVVQAGTIAGCLHLLHSGFLAHDGKAICQLRGSWGEDNTREELRRARRKRLIWGSVDSITVQNGDIDHLVVTRRGGLVAIDTKWRTRPGDTLDMAREARRAKLRAEAVARSVTVREPGARHRSRNNPLPVTAVVVVWGAAQHTLSESVRVDGIEFIPGRRLVPWLKTLATEPVTKAVADDLISRLEQFRADAWPSATRQA